ncbi:MAG: proteasome lid subunit RPN8/RPN11 [Gammaproteobacteria bacterium]
MNQIALDATHYSSIIDHARASPTQEVCGLLGGLEERCLTVYPGKNIAPTPECAFYMDPHTQLMAMRLMLERGEELVGIYHSHPSSAARPSARDLDCASYSSVAYLIVSLIDLKNPTLAAFRLDNNAFKPLQLAIEESAKTEHSSTICAHE